MFKRIARLLALGGALVALTAAVAGCHEEVAGVSESCTTGATTLHDGFLANRTVSFRIATRTDPTNSSNTQICYRYKAPDTQDGGRIDVNPNTGIGAARVTTDTSSRECTSTSGNQVPGPHPMEEGEILDTPIFLDAYASFAPSAWLCFEVAGLKERVKVEVPGADIADVDVNNDPAPPPMTDTTPPPAGKASTACSAGTFGPANEIANVHLNGRDLFLYTAQPNQTEAHICARISGPQSGGVRLSANAAPNQIVRIETSPDTTPCTQDIVTLSNPPLSIKISPAGSSPRSVCVNGTRYTVVTGPIPPVVSFAVDS